MIDHDRAIDLGRVLPEDDERATNLAPTRMRYADDRNFQHLFKFNDNPLDLRRINILAARVRV